MKKILYLLADAFIIALYIGAYMIQSFTRRKLGMVRWYNYHENKWKEMMPIEILRFIAPAILLVVVVLIIIRYKKREHKRMLVTLMVIVTLVLTVFYVGFTFTQSADTIRSYYLILPLIGMAALVQLIKTSIAMTIK